MVRQNAFAPFEADSKEGEIPRARWSIRKGMKYALAVAIGCLIWSRTASAATADSHTLFLNDCQPSGCSIRVGNTNATTDTSDIPSTGSTVAAFNLGTAAWASVLSCVRSVMSPFDLTVTDQRPASGNYFEVIVAGTPSDLGLGSGTLAIGDAACTSVGNCRSFQSNALAFAFANVSVFASDLNGLCGDALQAIAGSWALDHVVDASDVMSYNAYSGVRTFHDAEACGSDCSNGQSPFGSACTGSGGTATHVCTSTGTSTQDEVQTLLALFGPASDNGQAGADSGGQAGESAAAGESGNGGSGGTSAGAAGADDNAGAGGQTSASGAQGGVSSGGHAGSGTHATGGESGRPGGTSIRGHGGSGASTPQSSSSSSGCGCRLSRRGPGRVAFLVPALAALMVLRRRSRRRGDRVRQWRVLS